MRGALAGIATVVVVMTAPARSAAAAPSDVAGIGTLFEELAVAAEATPTVVFGIADATGARSTAYGYTELAYNTVAGGVYTHLLIATAADDDAASLAALVGADLVHNALVAHGIVTVAERRAWPASTTAVVATSLLSVELFQPLRDPDDQDAAPLSMAMAVASVSINTALAGGYSYRAVRDFQRGHNGLGAANVTGAVFAFSFAVAAVTAESRPRMHGIAPTFLDDGHGGAALGFGVNGKLR